VAKHVNGQRRGQTPLTMSIAPGAHTLTLRSAGAERTVPLTVAAGAQGAQDFDLEPAEPVTASARLSIVTSVVVNAEPQRSRVFRKALIAAVVGGTGLAVTGYWSRPAGRPHAPPAVAATAAPIAPPTRPPSPPRPEPAAVQPQPQGKPQTRAEPASRGFDEDRDPVQRARVLAQRPDVKGLVALREEVLRRSEASGEKESPAATRQLDEIDRYLTEARVLRLKLDAAEFRKGTANGVPPR